MDSFQLHGHIYSGDDSLSILDTVHGKSALIITDKFMVEFGYLKPIEAILREKGMQISVYAGVKPDPGTDIIREGVVAFAEADPDVLIAVGGGSPIDAAKGVMYFYKEMSEAKGKTWRRPKFIAVPTTSGTGSECTSFAVITTELGEICIVEDWLVPDIAILSAAYTLGVPEKITYDTGLDALTHAMEAYVSTGANTFTDALAEKVVRIIFDALPKLKVNLKDKEARSLMHEASCIAGMAFSQAGLGINHSLAHALGAHYHVPHGRANTVLIETIMDYNAGPRPLNEENTVAKKYAALAGVLGLPAKTAKEGFISLRTAVTALKELLGVPHNISELGIEEEDLLKASRSFVKNVLQDRCTPTSPRQPSEEDILELYRAAYSRTV